MILRRWSAPIRSEDEREYVAYVQATGLDGYRNTPGNLGYQLLVRTVGDGTTQVTTLSWWKSMDAVREFAGATPELARYYPEDDRFLLEKPEQVEHHRILSDGLSLARSRGGLVGH
ncbi:MAG: hypothetical protein H0W74_13250 [Sphingosinicella sp.]|nr:hypothetical protein [Sphingosinicella sp.]